MRVKALAAVLVVVTIILAFVLLWTGKEVGSEDGKRLKHAPEPLVYLRRLLFSPGDLSRPHHGLDCADCHIPFGKMSDSLCRDCHSSEKFVKTAGNPVLSAHTAMLDSPGIAGETNLCFFCHSEHRGMSAAASRPVSDVGHEKLFAVEIDCVTCHAANFTHHVNMLNENCADCHSVSNWSTPFSHGRLPELQAYLEGKGRAALNRDVCGQCHEAGWHLERNQASGIAAGGFECLLCHEKLFED